MDCPITNGVLTAALTPVHFITGSNALEKTCYDIPPAAMYARCAFPEKQEVVKLEILPEQPAEVTEQKELFSPPDQGKAPVIEISCGTATIRITNDITPQLLNQVIRAAGGLSC